MKTGSERLSDLQEGHTARKGQNWDASHFSPPPSWLPFSTQTLMWNSHFHPCRESWNGGFLRGPVSENHLQEKQGSDEGWKCV